MKSSESAHDRNDIILDTEKLRYRGDSMGWQTAAITFINLIRIEKNWNFIMRDARERSKELQLTSNIAISR